MFSSVPCHPTRAVRCETGKHGDVIAPGTRNRPRGARPGPPRMTSSLTASALQPSLAGRYAIERELGHGGMATVFLAHDLKHDRDVAIKVLDPDLARSIANERFLREIGISARLNHPHVLPLLDSGVA